MKQASSASTCTAAGLSLGTVSLPDSSGWVDPDLGDKPTVTGPPSVVGGDKTGSQKNKDEAKIRISILV